MPRDRNQRIVKFDLYSVHAHVNDEAVDYRQLLQVWATSLNRYHKEFERSRNIAIPKATLLEGRLYLVAYTGYNSASLLFFDTTKNEEQNQPNSPNRFQARKTHVLIDATTRRVAIEATLGGVTSSDLEIVLESVVNNDERFKDLEVDLTPIPGPAFRQGIDEFVRIKSAKIIIARPNFDWTDFHNELGELGQDSKARLLEVSAQSRRNQSLAKDSGLVQRIKDLADAPIAALKNAMVSGSKQKDGPLITLNLNKHIQRQSVPIVSDGGQIDEEDARRKMTGIVNPN